MQKPQLKSFLFFFTQSDYLRKISLKMLSMESQTKTQQNPGNAQVIPNQNPPGPGSIHIKCNITPFFCAINVFASQKKKKNAGKIFRA